MKKLDPFTMDRKALAAEVVAFEAMLQSKRTLDEAKDILPFFKANRNVAAFLGIFSSGIGVPDRIAFEFDVSGDFACDLVVGDWNRKTYCFIEFENAAPNSIFNTTAKATPEWSRRFEHGFSQIVDWFHRLDDEANTTKWSTLLGDPHVKYSGMLILGRDSYLGPAEQHRLSWRSERVLVNSKPILCRTFDQLLRDVKEKRANLKSVV